MRPTYEKTPYKQVFTQERNADSARASHPFSQTTSKRSTRALELGEPFGSELAQTATGCLRKGIVLRWALAPALLVAGALACLFARGQISAANAKQLWSKALGRHQSYPLVALADASKAAAIQWGTHPDKCLDMAGDGKGAGLQIWDCDNDYPIQQRFIVPKEGGMGFIRWATNPNFCLDAPKATNVEFWNCAEAPTRNLLWIISPDGKGRIHLAKHPHLCLDVPEGKTTNGWKLQVWDCDHAKGNGNDDNLRFVTNRVMANRVDCQWTAWSEWGPCSTTCGGGHQVRVRQISKKPEHGGNACGVKAGDSQQCNSVSCVTHFTDAAAATTTTTTALKESGGGSDVQASTPTSMTCPWGVHLGKTSLGPYAGGISTAFDLEGAKSECFRLGPSMCRVVTCGRDGLCTVRKEPDLQDSPYRESSYVPAPECFQTPKKSTVIKTEAPGRSGTVHQNTALPFFALFCFGVHRV